jgi:hypothetical protein
MVLEKLIQIRNGKGKIIYSRPEINISTLEER